MKYEIKLGGHIDILNRDELENALEKQTFALLAQARGVKHFFFSAPGTVSAGGVTIPGPNPNVISQNQQPILGPEDGFIWAVQRLTIDGLTKDVSNTPSIVSTGGSVTDPGAGATIATLSGLTPGTAYNLQWSVGLSGTVTTSDANNMELSGTGLSATDIAFYPGTDGNYPQLPVTIVPPAATVTVKAIAAASGASAVYGATMTATPANNELDSIIFYRNQVGGAYRLGSVTAEREFWHPGGHGLILHGGDQIIAVGTSLVSTGTLTLNGEAVEVPAEMLAKLVL